MLYPLLGAAISIKTARGLVKQLCINHSLPFPVVRCLRDKDGPLTNAAGACFNNGRVYFRPIVDTRVVLHELAHYTCLVRGDAFDHGPRFMGHYLKLLAVWNIAGLEKSLYQKGIHFS
jgi:hypothetical protein